MREILFRAKAINRIDGREYRTKYKNGDWVFGLLSKPYHDFDGYIQPAEMRNTDGVGGIDVDHETLGQFTGLTDKNGVRIFEGDIIRYIPKYGAPIIGVVVYGDYSFPPENTRFHRGCYIKWTSEPSPRQELGFWTMKRKIEVIGNIYDNPELVGGVNK